MRTLDGHRWDRAAGWSEECEECGYPFDDGEDLVINLDDESVYCGVACAEKAQERRDKKEALARGEE